jgi:hypothetical protein
MRRHPFIPRHFVAAPRGMPIPLRSIGCLPVVASLLPPGTALMRLRFAQLPFVPPSRERYLFLLSAFGLRIILPARKTVDIPRQIAFGTLFARKNAENPRRDDMLRYTKDLRLSSVSIIFET